MEARNEDELLFLGAAFIEDAFDGHGPWVFEVIDNLEVPEGTRETLRRGTFRPLK
ncbi:MAG: hypothetical protein JWP32_1321 [Schumannella sp.]|nr:hypothetical protein [Schumannella sp.]